MARDYNAWIASVATALLNVVRQTTQQCVSAVNQTQVANIVAKGGETVNIGNINWNQAVNINQGCITSALSNNLHQQAQQEAHSIATAMGIDSQSSEGQSIAQAVDNLATAIADSYQGQCGNIVSQVVAFNGPPGNAIGSLSWTQTQDTIISCLSDNNTVVTAKNELYQVLNQVGGPSLPAPSSLPSFPETRKLAELNSTSNCVVWILGILILLLFIYALWSNRHIV